MRKFWLAGLVLATALATAPGANADSTFYFNLSGSAITDITNGNCCAPSISGNGFLTGVWDPTNPGNFDITGSSGVTFTFNWPDPSTPASPSLVGTYSASIYLTGEPTSPGYPYSLQYYPLGTNSSNYIFPFDDILTPGPKPVVDTNGLVFELSGTGYTAAIAIYSGTAENPGVACTTSSDCVYWWSEYLTSPDSLAGPYPGIPIAVNNAGLGDPLDDFSLSPEPSSLLLFGTGLLGLAAFLYRRRQTEQHRAA